MILSNFLIALLALKLHTASTSPEDELFPSEVSSVLNTSVPTSPINSPSLKQELDFSSDSFRWFGVATQAGMTVGSVIVTTLLVTDVLSASDDDAAYY